MEGRRSPTKEGYPVLNRSKQRSRRKESQMKQSPPVGHSDGLRPAQDVEFSEKRLDVALDGDFRNSQVSPDQFVGFAHGKETQDIQFARSQFFGGQTLGQFRRYAGRQIGSAGMHLANALKEFFAPHVFEQIR